MEVFEKIINDFKPPANSARGPSWMFDSVLNTLLVSL